MKHFVLFALISDHSQNWNGTHKGLFMGLTHTFFGSFNLNGCVYYCFVLSFLEQGTVKERYIVLLVCFMSHSPQPY